MKYELTSKINVLGEWYRADKPERRMAGAFSWDGKATLEVTDGFLPPKSGPLFDLDSAPCEAIHGETQDSQCITLLRPRQVGGSLSFGPAGMRRPEKYRSSFVLIGTHATPGDDFNSLRARIPRLELWLDQPGLSAVKRGDALLVSVPINPAVSFSIPSMKADLTLMSQFGLHPMSSTSFAAKASGFVTIGSSYPRSAEWFVDQLWKITTFLSLVAAESFSPDHLELTVAGNEKQTVALLADLKSLPVNGCDDSSKFFVSEPKMQVPLEKALNRWLDSHDSIGFPAQLALAVLSSKGLWLHVEFLTLVHALEGFHRATTSKKKMSLSSRLRDLAAHFEESVRRRLFGTDGQPPASWVRTRNYYTHWNEEDRASALDTAEMQHAIVRMRAWLRVLYMWHTGIPQEVIATALDGVSRDAQRLIQVNAEEIRKLNPDSTAGSFGYLRIGDSQIAPGGN